MRLLLELFIIFVIVSTCFFVYQNYWDDLKYILFSVEPSYVVYVGDVALEVTVADEQSERISGLSGTVSLDDYEGKLFIYETSGQHGIWMRDMLIPIDIFWFNDDLELVHYEKNITPNTYPEVFSPNKPARFVLEMNANFIDSLRIELGDRLVLPSTLLPTDIREKLQK